MAFPLKAHWIDTLTRIADAGNDGIRGTDVDRRSAAVLEHRGLVISFEKRFYSGLDDVPGMSTWYRLTDAGTIWLIKHENPTPSSRVLPAGWTLVEAGYCLHTASRIEVRRDGRKWGVLRPLTADPTATRATTMYSVVDVKPTRAAALAAAAKAIPAALQLIADATARPDLVELITSSAHYPAKFPLIDFGQDWACGPCTKELGSGTGMVLWECEAFRKAREAGAAELALAQAERDVITAEAALRVAAVAERDTTPESNRLRTAEINYTRRRLAVDVLTRDPDMRLLMVSVSGDDGSTWTPVRWSGWVAVPGETAAEQAERYAVTRHLIEPPPGPKADPWGLLDNPRPLRVEVFADPMDTDPAGVWTNLTGPCTPGGHDPGPNPVTGGPAVQTGCCARCLHRVWRRPGGSWLLEGEPLPSPGPSPSPSPSGNPDPDPHEKIINSGSPSSGPGPGPGPDAPPSFGWRIETRTGRHWRSVRTGNSPALFYSDPVVLWGAADTILGNARQVLGLGPAEPMPAVRVRTWDRQTGLVRFAATRNRKVNEHA